MRNSKTNINVIGLGDFAPSRLPAETEVQAGFKNLPRGRQHDKFLSHLFSNKLITKYVKA